MFGRVLDLRGDNAELRSPQMLAVCLVAFNPPREIARRGPEEEHDLSMGAMAVHPDLHRIELPVGQSDIVAIDEVTA